jgi:ESCRT-II complex subunit VPS22
MGLSRRRAGIHGLKGKQGAAAKFKAIGKEIEAEQLDHVKAAMDVFKENLEKFAAKHKKDINRSPQFRAQFALMCQKVGVDPLASTKGFWAELLGVGDFYYELAVQIVDVCLATRPQNGGLIALEELIRRLRRLRATGSQAISTDDVQRAVGKMKVLGSGFGIIEIGQEKMVVSVPVEFNKDHFQIIALASETAFVTIPLIQSSLGWPIERAKSAIDLLMREGMAWIDTNTPSGIVEFWIPSVFSALEEQ